MKYAKPKDMSSQVPTQISNPNSNECVYVQKGENMNEGEVCKNGGNGKGNEVQGKCKAGVKGEVYTCGYE
jgi:hypothetical protein